MTVSAVTDPPSEPLEMIIYEVQAGHGLRWAPATATRGWMDKTAHRNAYHCLPMLMANQCGWQLLSSTLVRARWNGGNGTEAIEFDFSDPGTASAMADARAQASGAITEQQAFPTSTFGHGIVTWYIPFVIRTPPGYNLLVRGPANLAKDGITALEGLVETDWAPMGFTMNWRFTRPGVWVTFEVDFPIAMIVPQRRGEIERFAPVVKSLTDDPALAAAWAGWNAARNAANAAYFRDPDGHPPWQQYYLKGRCPDGTPAPEHQMRLRLRPPFVESRCPAGGSPCQMEPADDGPTLQQD